MAESYFELLTGQQRLPAKPFDPVGELKRLRRSLALRIQNPNLPQEHAAFSDSAEIEPDIIYPFSPPDGTSPPTEPRPFESVSLEAVVKNVSSIKNTLTIWQRSRARTKSPHKDIFRGKRPELRTRFGKTKQIPTVVSQYLSAPQEGTLEMINAGLMALGIIGVVFGLASFFRGWESDLSLGFIVCLSGAAITTVGLGGRFLAAYADL